ncbi:MAG: 2-phosphosulfolactate phosphatase [Tepidisphaeraceae bacterium]
MTDLLSIDVAFLPHDLRFDRLVHQTVVVFDVLRATTTMTAALAAGVREIRIFGDLDAASSAARASEIAAKLLCGEHRCLRPPGFDLGNSPGAFDPARHRGATVFMSTTNGTRAIVAAAGVRRILAGALVNARAVARQLLEHGGDVVLLCAGTDGAVAMEDVLGAGAVVREIIGDRPPAGPIATRSAGTVQLTDAARVALYLFESRRDDLPGALRICQGGQNVIAAGLGEDVDFAARLNTIDIVGAVPLADNNQLLLVQSASN